jgi:hypothetical protein
MEIAMSIPRGIGLNGKSIYTNVCKPVLINCNFIVDSANGNGLGVRSVKSNGYVESVFMYTSSTPGVVGSYTNPVPPAGYAQIRFKNNFNYYLGGFSGQVIPLTSTSTTSVTSGSVYVITALGTATLAQWQAVGLPQGLVPTVGQAFTAIASQSIGGSAHVGVPGFPSSYIVSVIGDPNQSLNNSNVASNAGAQLYVQFAQPSITGTVGALTFTGSALGTHTHNFTVIGGQGAATTNVIADYAGPLIGKQAASNSTYLGANSGTDGGVVAASAGTPAGTINTPAFTSTSTVVAAAPADNTVIAMQFLFDASSVTIDGI